MKLKTKLTHEHMRNTVRQIATAWEIFLFDTSALAENWSEGALVGPVLLKNDLCTQLAMRSVRRRTAHRILAVEASLLAWL